jgi:hypothetical protein
MHTHKPQFAAPDKRVSILKVRASLTQRLYFSSLEYNARLVPFEDKIIVKCFSVGSDDAFLRVLR